MSVIVCPRTLSVLLSMCNTPWVWFWGWKEHRSETQNWPIPSVPDRPAGGKVRVVRTCAMSEQFKEQNLYRQSRFCNSQRIPSSRTCSVVQARVKYRKHSMTLVKIFGIVSGLKLYHHILKLEGDQL